jgi:cytochrome c-type biogenesis protein CcmH
MAKFLWTLCWLVAAVGAYAAEAPPASNDPVLDAKVNKIASELRCLVCQNQTIADSHAELAVDLRNQVREMVKNGQTEQQITEYMTARYGDFVLYRPPFNAATALLWVGPGVMVVGGLLTLFIVLRRRSKMSPDKFDPDEAEVPQDPHHS